MAKIDHYTELGITEEAIKNTEKVLEDNGIEADEVQSVLQAIGYSLLDCELYPSQVYPTIGETPILDNGEPDEFFKFKTLTKEDRELCAKAWESVWSWCKEVPQDEYFSQELEKQYEKATGKSCVYWMSESNNDGDCFHDTLPRDEDYTTNGYTESFNEYAKKRIADAVAHGAKTLVAVATLIKKGN